MSTFLYQLDTSSKKFICPVCNHRTFVRYINIQTKHYLGETIGRCDREVKCGYLKSPSFENENVIIKTQNTELPRYYIPIDIYKRTLKHYNQNNLISFLKLIFPKDKITDLINTYKIGTSKKWDGASVFWQINSKGIIGQGKIMLFDPKTGKRIKKPFPHISSVHSELGKRDKKPEACFFGEHLLSLNNRKSFAIVESEKTAIVMAGISNKYNWVASGGLSNLNSKRMQAFKKHQIVFYPDLGAYEKWKCKSVELNKIGFNISVSDLLEKKSTEKDREEGFDIADYFIKIKLPVIEKSDILQKMVDKNNSVQLLIDKFNLIESRRYY